MTLAVGIATLAAIGTFAYAVHWRPLPFANADRLVAVTEVTPGESADFSSVSADIAAAFSQIGSFERVSAYQVDPAILTARQQTRRVMVLRLDTAFARVFQLRPQVGRLLLPEELESGASSALISDLLWRSSFEGDSSVIGQQLVLQGRSYLVVGVLPTKFRFPWQSDVFIPLKLPKERGAERELVSIAAKLSAGASRMDANTELGLLPERLRTAGVNLKSGTRFVVRPEVLDRQGNRFLPQPLFFIAAAALVLIVACSNVGTLVLARATERRTTYAIRAALGASRARMLRLILAEILLLAAAGALSGILLSVWLLQLALRWLPTQGLPSWIEFVIDPTMIAAAAVLLVLVTLLVGLTPARLNTRLDAARSVLSIAGQALGRTERRRMDRGPVVQVAVAVTLMVVALLFWRSQQSLSHMDAGYDAVRIAATALYWDDRASDDVERRARVMDELLAATRRLPTVRAAAFRGYYVGDRGRGASGSSRPDERLFTDADTGRQRPVIANARRFVVSDGYFEVLRLPLVRGRMFSQSDATGAEPVAVVSQSFAAAAWPDMDPLRQSIAIGPTGARHTVIGVVEDVRELRGGAHGIRPGPRADVYFASTQAWFDQPLLIARGDGEPTALSQAMGRLVQTIDASALIASSGTMADQFAELMMVGRVLASLVGGFSGVSLALAALGLFGVTAYSVSRRRMEIGIRMALGATARDVATMVIAGALRLSANGLVIGSLLAALAAQLVRPVLVETSSLDPVAYGAAATLLMFVTVIASLAPAHRAIREDPAISLRAP